MEKSELIQLQKKELEIFKIIRDICEKHGITYYALGGTFLGAIRHKGFIPWDDDIDISVPRPQYEKLLEILDNELPDYLKLMYFKKQKDDPRPIYAAQIWDTRTKIIQHITNKPIETHVWVDIFPLDGMPNNALLRKLHGFHLLYRRARIQFSMYDENVHQGRKNRPWYEKLAMKFYEVTKLGSHAKPYDMMVKMDQALTMYDYDKCDYIVNFMGAWKLKEVFKKEDFGEGKEYPFEDTTIHGAINYDAVLTHMYGDYMKPISNPDEQIKHHDIEIIDLGD